MVSSSSGKVANFLGNILGSVEFDSEELRFEFINTQFIYFECHFQYLCHFMPQFTIIYMEVS